jgi:hypothetical protein
VWDPQNLFVVSASLDQTCRVFAPWNRDVDGQKTTTWHEMGRSQIHGYDMQCVAFIDKWRYVSGADEKVRFATGDRYRLSRRINLICALQGYAYFRCPKNFY